MATTRKSAKEKAAADGKVTLALAHPIPAAYQTGLGLDLKDDNADYAVGEEISVYPHIARAIINAGYAQVDPENPSAVAEALGISEEAAVAVVAEMAGPGTVEPSVEPTP